MHLVNPVHGHILELHEQGGHPHLQGVRAHAGGQGVARLHEGQLQGAHLAVSLLGRYKTQCGLLTWVEVR